MPKSTPSSSRARLALQSLALSSLALAGFSASLVASPSAKLEGFDYLKIGMPYTQLVAMKASCDAPKDAPRFRDSSQKGVSSIVCPTSETFAMAILLEDRVASVVVNWVSWDKEKLTQANADTQLGKITSGLRKQYGIPTNTVPYESEFGNKEADALCASPDYSCQMHIWKTNQPDRVASLVFAKNANREIPLLLHLSDLTAEAEIDSIKNGALQASENSSKKEAPKAH